MPIDQRPFITLTFDFDTHVKIDALSEAAAWNVVRLLIWSAKADKDGFIPDHRWQKVKAAHRKEMLTHGVVVKRSGGVVFRDYLRHQLSAAERQALSAKRSDAGSRGAHERWHVDLGVNNPACPHCPKGGDEPPASDEDEEMASAMASAMPGPMANAPNPMATASQGPWQNDGRDNTRGKALVETSGGVSPTATPATRPPRQCQKHKGMTDVPACGACKDARIAHDEWVAPIASVKQCDYDEDHGTYTTRICGKCQADIFVGDIPWRAGYRQIGESA